MSTETKTTLSLADFNATAKCENAFEFAYLDPNGNETPWKIQVLGDQSEKVKRSIYTKINKKRQQEEFLKKKGKELPVEDIEDIVDDNFDTLASCIVGWSGIEEEYSPELAKSALKNNKSLVEQVRSASENLANFI